LPADGGQPEQEERHEAAGHDRTDLEARARAKGWRPREDWRGDPSKWVPAEDFLEETVPVLRERIRSFEERERRRDEEFRTLNDRLSETQQVLTEFRDFSHSAEQRAYERARRELEARRLEAVHSADPQRFSAIEAEIAELDRTKPADVGRRHEQPPAGARPLPPPSAELQTWLDDNPWFHKDPVLNIAAIDTMNHVMADLPSAGEAERLAEVTRRVREEFPRRFGANPRRAAPAAVTPPSGGRAAKKTRSFDDLPADARKAYERFAAQMPGYSKEEYVKHYDWSE
jgi:hypothetical protein